MKTLVAPEIEAYAQAHSMPESDSARGLREETQRTMDYAQMLVRSNPAEAKRVYEAVKARVGPDSLVYGRVKKMEKTFN